MDHIAGDPGLSSREAQSRLDKYGRNEIVSSDPIRFYKIALEEMREPMILLLLATGVIYSVIGGLGDAITIFAVIILLVLFEVFTEYRAKKAISSLGEITAPKSHVLRDGKVANIDNLHIVPGDVLVLAPGTRVAADAHLERSISLEIDESLLTGETLGVDKNVGDEVFAGTTVVTGEGRAIVTGTGPATRLGKIAAQLLEIKIARTPLQLAMRTLAAKLAVVALFLSVTIPLAGILRGQDWKLMVVTGLALAFATIPEELPIVITLVLGLGAYNLSKQNFLVKKIRAAEAMANTTVIVTDKTGTITEGQMKLVSLFPGDRLDILQYAAGSIPEFAQSPLDIEILRKARQAGFKDFPQPVRERGLQNGHKTKCMLRRQDGALRLYLSGAPEEVFAACRHVPEQARIELEQQTHSGRRVIAVASKMLEASEADLGFDRIATGLDTIGLLCFEDSPRPGVKETLSQAADAGIRTLIVTGDHPATAAAIAFQVGIDAGQVLTGAELDRIDDLSMGEVLEKTSVFARTTPEHKYRIVSALQKNHEIVAVTGDGINDVLALKAANIGIAMGLRGTDVAREAAGAILADDNYSTLTQGIFESRALFDNLVKGIKYYLTIKLALILIFILPVVLGLPMPFSPIQIIILELFMDLAASAGFVTEPKETDVYTRPPRDPQQNIFSRAVLINMVVKSLVLFMAVIAVYLYADYTGSSLIESQTYTFAAWIVGHVALAFISRSEKDSILTIGLFSNRAMNVWALAAVSFVLLAIYLPEINPLVHLAPIPLPHLLLVWAFVLVVVSSLELMKKILTKT